VDLPFAAHLPTSYVDDFNLRLALYQRLAAVDSVDAVGEIAEELRDRFGMLPPAAENLLFAVRARALAKRTDVVSIRQVGDDLVVQTRGELSPKERLRGLSIKGLTAGPAQARLDLRVLDDRWPEALTRVLRELVAQDPAING
jgi:transcription-repair coupling factor (superfamily II helicase)